MLTLVVEPTSKAGTERWKPVVGYEGVYSVSDQGRVRRELNNAQTQEKQLVLQPQKSQRGYHVIRFYNRDKGRNFQIHRVVLEAFVGPCPKNMEALHTISSCKTDNRLCNLRWGTRKENVADTKRHGHFLEGEKVKTSKLKEYQVKEILASSLSSIDLAKIYGVGDRLIARIRAGEMWLSVSKLKEPIRMPSFTTGTHNGNAKLTTEAVLEIRSSKEAGRVIAKRLGISPAVVWQIRKRETWRHV